jgi:hypothetical protein
MKKEFAPVSRRAKISLKGIGLFVTIVYRDLTAIIYTSFAATLLQIYNTSS